MTQGVGDTAISAAPELYRVVHHALSINRPLFVVARYPLLSI
ncbi:hypothetical protein ymoll0001_13480 [Yersinia mollaretii ATCC 43969]|uniref:Uncharacterized protein n=1 Tax=Yersinia mollaretii (strain ATCC 43969 / DSM 18520 / CIP 103324 / CNY 7263 / WAIP 204) TaxID=349967 RepID=A0ABM9Y6Z5_YERMW|nr:hypothetical protein ymoll0001_13480 [Yersinia mollaretii ATCC 43969]